MPCYALLSDTKEPVQITADSSLYNHRQLTNIFEGHVKVDQGNAHLTADKLVIKNNKLHKIREAVAYGGSDLAHYWSSSKENAPLFHARAQIMRFYPLESVIVLETQVKVNQGGNSFNGPLIIYNTSTQTITVPNSSHGHATIVYDPETNKIFP